MNTSLFAIINRIIAEEGEDILADSQRLKSFFKLYAHNEPKDQCRAFGRCIEQGCYQEFKKTRVAAERQKLKPWFSQNLQSTTGLSSALCDDALDLLEAVMFGIAAPAPVPSAFMPAPAAAPVPAPSPQPAPAPAQLSQSKPPMSGSLLAIINRIITEEGEAILADPPRLKSFFKLYAQNEPKDRCLAFGRCIEQGCYQELKNTKTVNERWRIKAALAQQVRINAGIDAASAADALDLLEAVIFPTPQTSMALVSVQSNAPASVPAVPQPAGSVAGKTAFMPRPLKKKHVLIGAAAGVIIIVLIGVISIRSIGGGRSDDMVSHGEGTDGGGSVDGSSHNGVSPVDFSPLVEFHGEAFPVKILATASTNKASGGGPRMIETDDYIGDAIGDFGVTLSVQGGSEKIPVVVEIEGDRFIKKTSFEAKVPAGKTVEVFPRIVYDYAELERLQQPAEANISFRVFMDSKLKGEKREVVRFHSVNEVPFRELSRWDNTTPIDNSRLFAAMVNEDDPLIDKILKEVIDCGAMEEIGGPAYSGFFGYQDADGDGDTENEVMAQVFGVWNVLQNHNIRYSNLTGTSTANESLASQYVRTIGESFENTQANCVDGSVLFASVLKKLEFDTFLVLIPGHMFLGCWLDSDGKTGPMFIETTMLGDNNIKQFAAQYLGSENIQRAVGNSRWIETSFNTFLSALKTGDATANSVGSYFKDDNNIEYRLINIGNMRAEGIKPIRRQ